MSIENKLILTIVVIFAAVLGFHWHQNKENRETYLRCLEVAEAQIKNQTEKRETGIHIVSSVSCYQR